MTTTSRSIALCSIAAALLVAAACKPAKAPPIPPGPPPEYEPARPFDGGVAGDELPGAAPADAPP